MQICWGGGNIKYKTSTNSTNIHWHLFLRNFGTLAHFRKIIHFYYNFTKSNNFKVDYLFSEIFSWKTLRRCFDVSERQDIFIITLQNQNWISGKLFIHQDHFLRNSMLPFRYFRKTRHSYYHNFMKTEIKVDHLSFEIFL